MVLLRNLIKLRSNVRLYSNVIYNESMPNHFERREVLLNQLLKNHDFSDKQQKNLYKFIVDNQIQLTDQDLFKIDSSIKFWKKYVEERPTLSKDGSDLLDHLHVLSTVEPRLLFIELPEMKRRVGLVNNSGFVDCKQDVARLFLKAPTAVFLQNWSDVIYKAYYIHHRIVYWLVDQKPTALYPHPIVKYPRVLEMPYEDIKARFLFAMNSGYRAKGLFQNLSKATPYDVFRDLLATEFGLYLENVCRGLSEEEYEVFREMIKLQQREEDEIFRNLSILNNSISCDDQELPSYR